MDRKSLLAQERLFRWTDKPSALRVALVFPNRYTLGMSNLGFQVVYRLINEQPGFSCERVFLPEGEKLQSLETGRALREFDLVAFSLSFELDYPHVLQILDEAGLERNKGPLLIAGGPAVTGNPEPVADFFDAILLGDAESTLPPFLDTFRRARENEENREEQLLALAQGPGCYVPALYECEYDPHFVKTTPIRPEVPATVVRQWSRDFADSVLLTPNTEFADTYLVETARGCAHGCRFCLAGSITRPFRSRPFESLKEAIERGLQWTEKIGLLGAAVSDLPCIDPLIDFLANETDKKARLYLSSIRADRVTPQLIALLRQGGLKSLTIAPEAGTEDLRRCIKKGLDEASILQAVQRAGEGGMTGIKLYFMIGLPGEKEEPGIVELFEKVVAVGRPLGIRQFSTDIHPFVPKAHTPFQWASMRPVKELEETLATLQKRLTKLGVKVRVDSARWAHVQELLARGDRRTAKVLRAAVDKGGTLGAWRQAEKLCPPRRFAPEYPLPWSHLQSGPPRSFLEAEYRAALGDKGPANG